jgi:hypothetical protein
MEVVFGLNQNLVKVPSFILHFTIKDCDAQKKSKIFLTAAEIFDFGVEGNSQNPTDFGAQTLRVCKPSFLNRKSSICRRQN